MCEYSFPDTIGEPTWDFQKPVDIPFPEIFPYDIDDAQCLKLLGNSYKLGIEIRHEITIPPPLRDYLTCTWQEAASALGRPILPCRAFRDAFGKMDDATFKSEIQESIGWPWDTNLTIPWYPLRDSLGPPEYCWYLPEGYDMPKAKEHELNGWEYLAGTFIEEVEDAGIGALITATAAWHSDQWLCFVNRCQSRVIVVLNDADKALRVLKNQDLDSSIIWAPAGILASGSLRNAGFPSY